MTMPPLRSQYVCYIIMMPCVHQMNIPHEKTRILPQSIDASRERTEANAEHSHICQSVCRRFIRRYRRHWRRRRRRRQRHSAETNHGMRSLCIRKREKKIPLSRCGWVGEMANILRPFVWMGFGQHRTHELESTLCLCWRRWRTL